MGFHESYWATVGAGSPVVMVAHSILVGRYRRRVNEEVSAFAAAYRELAAEVRSMRESGTQIPPSCYVRGKELRRRQARNTYAGRIANVAEGLISLSLLSGGIALALALICLADRRDVAPTWLGSTLLLGAVALLLVSGWVDVVMASLMDADPEAAFGDLGDARYERPTREE